MSSEEKKGAAPAGEEQAQEEETENRAGPKEPAAEEAAQGEEAPKAQQEAAKELEKLQEQYNALNDRYLRTLAEYDNFRKRSQREKEAIYPQAVAATVEKFLPVVDNFERALQCECSDAEFKKGVDMIFDGLQKAMEALNVAAVGEVGEPFDANFHHAVMHVEDEALGENVVSQVLQKGYRIGERVIRCAMVGVAN